MSASVAGPSAFGSLEASAATRESKDRVAELDAMRFVAAMAVVFYHYTYRLSGQGGIESVFPAESRIAMHGYLGVELFFMISGFVILWTARDKRPSDFVISRLTRLYPEFWLAVLLSAAAFNAFRFGGNRIEWETVAANLTMVPQLLGFRYVDGVYWTLFVELKFYFLLWVLSVLGQMKRVESVVRVWIVIATVCFIVDMPGAVRSAVLYPYAPYFAAGCLFFLIRFHGATKARLVGVIVCFAMAMAHAPREIGNFVDVQDISERTILETRVVIASFFVIFAAVALRGRRRIPFARQIAFVGMLTYPLYLIHNIGKVAVLRPLSMHSRFAALVLALAFSLALATALVYLVEPRRRAFSRRLTSIYAKARQLVVARAS